MCAVAESGLCRFSLAERRKCILHIGMPVIRVQWIQVKDAYGGAGDVSVGSALDVGSLDVGVLDYMGGVLDKLKISTHRRARRPPA